jgi:transketolase
MRHGVAEPVRRGRTVVPSAVSSLAAHSIRALRVRSERNGATVGGDRGARADAMTGRVERAGRRRRDGSLGASRAVRPQRRFSGMASPRPASAPDLDLLCINTIRTLAMDAVEAAQSGHPGTPMALAPLAYLLYTRHLRHNPRNPEWPDRDRFVLSAGHASMLLYGTLHLVGYDLPLEEIRRFRQWGSRTPGHPEHGHTPGVETTTGPLGQGFANAVGMALAEAHLAARFNRDGHAVVDHRTYVVASDGDLMEGISHEAAALAGHLALGKLIVFYDDNHITIEGSTGLAYSDDVARRFEAYGWHVQRVADVNDLAALDAAACAAEAEAARPSLVIVRTHIAWGSPHKQDTAEAHGSPLGKDEVALTKRAYGWPEDQPFLVPEAARAHAGTCVARGAALEAAWRGRVAAF